MDLLKKIAVYFFTLVLIIFSVLPSHALANEATLEKGINKTVSQKLSKAKVGISIRDFNQKMVYEHNGNLGIKPASNMKLLTAATTLKTLGESYRFKTEMYIDGKVENGILNGNVYLLGQGDPTILQKDLENFAGALKTKMGIKQINGQLIADATWFDAEYLMRGVVKEDEWKYFAPQISALTLSPDTDYDVGNLIVTATPTKKGAQAKITLTPRTNHVAIVNQTKTVAKGYKNTVHIQRQYGTNRIVISGNMPIGQSEKEYVTVDNPAMYTLDVLTLAMKAQGITLSRSFGLKLGKVPVGATKITTKQSMPLKDIVKVNLKDSNNGMSEMFTKAIGRAVSNEGSWDAGIKVIYNYAASLGLNAAEWKIVDTSGLSHVNRITANEQTKLLWAVRQEGYYDTFLAGLPVAGNPDKSISTTLQKRLTNSYTRNRVHAKTGAITGVYSLSGYVHAKSGQWYIFSILTQDTTASAISAIDEIVTTIAKEM